MKYTVDIYSAKLYNLHCTCRYNGVHSAFLCPSSTLAIQKLRRLSTLLTANKLFCRSKFASFHVCVFLASLANNKQSEGERESTLAREEAMHADHKNGCPRLSASAENGRAPQDSERRPIEAIRERAAMLSASHSIHREIAEGNVRLVVQEPVVQGLAEQSVHFKIYHKFNSRKNENVCALQKSSFEGVQHDYAEACKKMRKKEQRGECDERKMREKRRIQTTGRNKDQNGLHSTPCETSSKGKESSSQIFYATVLHCIEVFTVTAVLQLLRFGCIHQIT